MALPLAYSAGRSSSPLTISPFIVSRSASHCAFTFSRCAEPTQQQERERGRVGYVYSSTGYMTLSCERVYGGAESEAGSPAQRQYATPVPVNGSTAQYAPGSTTTYAPGTSSPTPQYATPQYTTLGATPRTLTARTSTSTPSRRRLCRPRLHPRAPPRPSRAPLRRSRLRRRSQRERRGEGRGEEGYDAPAYTERTTEFATRYTPAAADFAQPRAHRPMAYLSLPASAASDKGDAEMVCVPGSSKPAHVDRHTGVAPQYADHPASDTRVCAAEQALRMRRLRVVPAAPLPDPSVHAYWPQQQAQQLQPQYRCIGGGYAGRWGVQSARTSPVRRHATPHARTTAALCGLGAVESGVGEVVPSYAPQVPSHAPQGLAHTHVPSHTLPQLAPLVHTAGTDAAPRRVCECGPPGVLSCETTDGWVTPPFYVPLAGFPAVPLSSRSTDTDTDMH
ncbi:hypothetical protein C8J57DRAFT_1466770 [Mycena rebaudengoi]|nr:hypothetical protein C8J57DRAFT_1466770 [Mycena rebaudengoi]